MWMARAARQARTRGWLIDSWSLDISHHIVADRNLPLPTDSRWLFELRARQSRPESSL
jgi:hypothetical protein